MTLKQIGIGILAAISILLASDAQATKRRDDPGTNYYRGTLGGKYPIQAILTFSGTGTGIAYGEYFYDKKPKGKLFLLGRFEANNILRLIESESQAIGSPETGRFEGRFADDSASRIVGKWTSPKGKVLDFELTEKSRFDVSGPYLLDFSAKRLDSNLIIQTIAGGKATFEFSEMNDKGRTCDASGTLDLKNGIGLPDDDAEHPIHFNFVRPGVIIVDGEGGSAYCGLGLTLNGTWLQEYEWHQKHGESAATEMSEATRQAALERMKAHIEKVFRNAP